MPDGGPGPTGPGSAESEAPRSSGTRKLLVLALAGALLGVPALLMFSLVTTQLPGEVVSGSQPGGPVVGRVVDSEGEPAAGVRIEAWGGVRQDVDTRRQMLTNIWQLPEEERSLERLAHATTNADGSFRIVLPPFEGYYGIAAGGGAWQRGYRELSLLGEEDEVVEPEPLEFELEPGSLLEVSVRRRDGRRVGRGRFEVSSLGGALRMGPTTLQSGEFEGDSIRLGALPPGEYEVEVVLTTGESFRAAVELVPGRNPLVAEL